MTATVWTIEFPDLGYGIFQAKDIVRQHTPRGAMVPGVQKEGRLGYLVAAADYALIEALRDDIESRGRPTIVGRR